jgi:hypothetical protein
VVSARVQSSEQIRAIRSSGHRLLHHAVLDELDQGADKGRIPVYRIVLVVGVAVGEDRSLEEAWASGQEQSILKRFQ